MIVYIHNNLIWICCSKRWNIVILMLLVLIVNSAIDLISFGSFTSSRFLVLPTPVCYWFIYIFMLVNHGCICTAFMLNGIGTDLFSTYLCFVFNINSYTFAVCSSIRIWHIRVWPSSYYSCYSVLKTNNKVRLR